MPYGTPRQLAAPAPQVAPPSGGYVSGRGGMPPGQQQNVWQGVGAPRQLPAGSALFTQGTSAVNPSANRPPYNPNAPQLPAGSPTQGQGVIQVPPPGAEGYQIPTAPRTAAPPADTSGIFREPLAQRMGRVIWNAVKPQ